MLKKLKTLARKFVTQSEQSAKHVTPVFFDSDIFLVSYPKSGNTWMRFLLANYITGGKVDLSQSNRLIPDIHYNPQDIVETLNPRIIKTHNPFTEKYKRVIYIVRDGRDVAVSYFFHLKKFNRLPAETTFGEYLETFIEGKLDRLGSWGAHVDGWLAGANDLLLIRYEDMLSDTPKVLEKVIRYCGLEFDEQKIAQSVSACSLGELREIEKRQFNDIKELSTSDPSTYFFRKGISGDWENYFSEDDKKKFLATFSETMNRVGYGN
jgi:hypothetical protein